nr:retrovirus-related Pol polyprotein from transposon TNT 1-94 [Tanacetum cinerariifolium]
RAKKKLKTVQNKKDGIQLTVKKLENASKSLNKLIDSQNVDNCKKVLGYNAVPPPYTDLKSDDEDESVPHPKIENKIVKPSVAKVEFVKPKKTESTCLDHLQKECNHHQRKFQNQKVVKPVWNYNQRVNYKNFVKNTYFCPKRNIDPRAVLIKSGIKSVNAARLKFSKAAITVSTARPVNTAHPKTTMNVVKPRSYISNSAHSLVKRPIQSKIAFKNSFINQRVNTVRNKQVNNARPKAVLNAVKGNEVYAVKASTCWVWKPKIKILDNVSKHNSASITLKKYDYIDAQGRSKPNCLFDIDALTKKMIYQPVVAGTQSNGNEGTKDNNHAGQAIKEKEPRKDYILLPLWTADPPFQQEPKSSQDVGFKPSNDVGKKVNEVPRQENECQDQEEKYSVNNTNRVNVVSSTINVAINEVTAVGRKSSIELPGDLNMPELEDTSIFEDSNEDVFDVKADLNNLESNFQGHTQKEGIDYDEVFATVARIETIRLFLDYVSLKDFVMYQMDVKSHFLYEKIKEEVYVCQPPRFEDLDFPDKVYKVEKALYGLHKALRAWFFEVKTASTPMKTQKPLIKDEDGEEVDCKKQTVVANSTTEAEYVVASSCCGQRIGKQFSSKETPLFPIMAGLNQVQMGEGLAQPTDIQQKPTFDMPPPKPKKTQKPRQPKRHTTKVHQPSESTDIAIDEKGLDLEDELKRTKTAQQTKIDGLERRVKKLRRSTGQELTSSRDCTKLVLLPGTHDDMVQDEGMKDGEEEVVKVVTTAKMLIDTVVDVAQVAIADVQLNKGKGKAKLIEEPKIPKKRKHQIEADKELAEKLNAKIDEEDRLARERAQKEQEKRRKFFAIKRIAKKRNKPPTKAQHRSIMSTYQKNIDGWKPRDLKNKSFAKINELFDEEMERINNFVNFKTELGEESSNKNEVETVQEISSKRAGDEFDQERSKKQKVEDDKESKELKKCLEIIPDDGDDVTIEATPFSSKSPTIIDYNIYKEGKKNYF